MRSYTVLLLVLYPALASAAASIEGLLQKSDLPTAAAGKDWLSLSPDLEFQPSGEQDSNADPRTAAMVKEATDRLLTRTGTAAEYTMQFMNGDETYYNHYSQAWRLLGLYIDCNAPAGYMSDCDGDEDGNNDNNSEDGNTPACQRYLMWAAYIDVDHQGGGIGEYQYFDRHSKTWDRSSCIAENGRCERMDCHLKNTNFKLLGIFKEPNYHSWMEQLFKHEGVCIWTSEEYSFMQNDREVWPCGCTETDSKDEDGNNLYYDTKPMPEGRISLGLYTDDRCSVDYDGEIDIVDVLASYQGDNHRNLNDNDYNGNIHDLAAQLETWNDAFDIYKVCQPCMAYDLSYNPNSAHNSNQNKDEDSGQVFDCMDDADYTNVNQCMKFRTKTQMLTADFRDIKLGSDQGTIVEIEILDETYGSGGYGRFGKMQESFTMTGERKVSTGSIIFFVISALVLLAALFFFCRARKKDNKSAMATPLVSGTATKKKGWFA